MRSLMRGLLFAAALHTAVLGQHNDTPSDAADSSTHDPATGLGNGSCPSRTANYITHTLVQQCLRTERTAVNATQDDPEQRISRDGQISSSLDDDASLDSTVTGEGAIATSELAATTTTVAQSTATVPVSSSNTAGSLDTNSAERESEADSPLDNSKFLSFEEWKKQNLAKLEEPIRDYREHVDRQRPGINNALDGFGEDGEIDLDFSGFGSPDDGVRQKQRGSSRPKAAPPPGTSPSTQTARSQDAGKTCKERTNYASFDCAATVLKNNPECKSASSILVENKDSYMLNTCSAKNKFFIVELCDPILIDTVVLANYEFFSSIFRHFRVSASDTYPVKLDKWKDLGTYEARNTREVQAFLVEHPQIWARYLRIEFLTHYGSEYYCPVSLLRVHGTTMLEDMRAQEEISQSDSIEDAIAEEVSGTHPLPAVPQEPPTATDEESIPTIQELAGMSVSVKTQSQDEVQVRSSTSASSTGQVPNNAAKQNVLEVSTSARSGILTYHARDETMCLSPSVAPVFKLTSGNGTVNQTDADPRVANANNSTSITLARSSTSSLSTSAKARSSLASRTISEQNESMPTSSSTAGTSSSKSMQDRMTNTTAVSDSSPSVDLAPSSSSDANITSRITPSSSTVSTAPHPQPSTQESFFKSIHKRLQQLESNSTLSLQYIEEQSRILRDAFSKVEKRQISATTSFLSNLNETVMHELRGFRQSYDQLWQSTVLELEGQREQYQREMLALSSRLTLVADELVWQKRMGIVQSTLLLLCLGLVLFARGSHPNYLEVPLMQQMMSKSTAAFGRPGWESPTNSPSPENRSPVSLFRRRLWRSVTEPSVGTDGDLSGLDSRPESKDGPAVDVRVEPPTPPGAESESGDEQWDDADDEAVFEPRVPNSGPATPRGTREREMLGDLEVDNG